MLHSIVVPCYKSSATIRKVVEMTSAELDRLGRHDYEFVLVDDRSPDEGQTLRTLTDLAREYPFVTGHGRSELCSGRPDHSYG